MVGANFDSHYWPFCKEQGNEHNAARLVLTQIICGDTLKDMYDQVHEMTKKCNINLDCNCCNDKKAKLDKKASKSQNAQKVEKIEIKVNHYYCFVCLKVAEIAFFILSAVMHFYLVIMYNKKGIKVPVF